MARSLTRTLLPLDEYARIMGIPGWVYNQVRHPLRNVPGCADGVVFQNGYAGDPTYFVGRDEIAAAIGTAEAQIAAVLGYWPAPKFICDERIDWVNPCRGPLHSVPVLQTRWGYVRGWGVEAFADVKDAAAIVYSDTDGDGITDWATITVAAVDAADVSSACDVVVVYPGETASTGWDIRPLTVVIDAVTDVVTITGPKWLFVDPDILATDEAAVLNVDAGFLATVDVYRRFQNANPMGTIIWDSICPPTEICTTSSVIGCCQTKDVRLGQFTIVPASWNVALDGWVRALWTGGYPPARVSVSYLAGYDDDTCVDCSQLGSSLKMAIARLANAHIVDHPCGCSIFNQRFESDREELEVVTRPAARALSLFGTTMRGAVFALSVVDQLSSIGKGG